MSKSKEEIFIVITTSGDGDIKVDQIHKSDLEKNLKVDEDGCCHYGMLGVDTKILESLTSTDPNYWGRSILIIKGDVVVPKLKAIYQLTMEDN